MIPSVDSKCSREESQTQVSSLLSQQKVLNGIIAEKKVAEKPHLKTLFNEWNANKYKQ